MLNFVCIDENFRCLVLDMVFIVEECGYKVGIVVKFYDMVMRVNVDNKEFDYVF